MKKILLTAALVGLTFTWAEDKEKHDKSHDSHDKMHKTAQFKGEVMDLTCYISHPKNGQGEGHAKCAKKCIQKGLPIGLLTEDGTLYLVTGADHKSAKELLADHAGKVVTIEGDLKEENGMKMIVAEKVSQ